MRGVLRLVATAVALIFSLAACASKTESDTEVQQIGKVSGNRVDWVDAACPSGTGTNEKPIGLGAFGGGICIGVPGDKSPPPSLLYEQFDSEDSMRSILESVNPAYYAAGGADGVVTAFFVMYGPFSSEQADTLQSFGFVINPGPQESRLSQATRVQIPSTQNPASVTDTPRPAPVPVPETRAQATTASGVFGTDSQGFVDQTGPRCNSTNQAVAVARTALSRVVICETGVGRLYYKGVGLQNGLGVEIDDPVHAAGGFSVTNIGVLYRLSPNALVITEGGSTLSDEPVLEYWSR